MELTLKQQEGLQIAVQRFLDKERYTVISGYAGTGKTFLVRRIIEALGLDEDKICYASFTGKAAEVLRLKGNKNSVTLHKLLYESIPRPDGTFFRKKRVLIPYKVVVIDECSMVPQDMIDQLASYSNVYYIFLGDPFQLPSFTGDQNNLLKHPHVFLDEIVRQAKESEIIRISMMIRNGEPLPYMKGKEVQILHSYELTTGILQWADQILVATNKQRFFINQQMRQLLNYTNDFEEGEKLVCCRNYWDTIGSLNNPLINGSIVYAHNIYESFYSIPFPRYINQNSAFHIFKCDIQTENNNEYYSNITLDKNLLLNHKKTLSPQQEFLLGRNPKTKFMVPLEFSYGYAITTHRAQGSQWNKVLVLEEKFPYNSEEHARWLYTACTRASEKLVLIR